ncbi:hypothetical protein SAMN03080602_03890 [Arenibacter troitsensis]|uniref:Uncharacterized protein n=1 Tax=Arenibacter troitsensis TaxID=188872 RepID=A0A1X7L802_9FLAO|nr:hypothetical protein SAMN03080602_03890 [Arenibacter troitsensis]
MSTATFVTLGLFHQKYAILNTLTYREFKTKKTSGEQQKSSKYKLQKEAEIPIVPQS